MRDRWRIIQVPSLCSAWHCQLWDNARDEAVVFFTVTPSNKRWTLQVVPDRRIQYSTRWYDPAPIKPPSVSLNATGDCVYVSFAETTAWALCLDLPRLPVAVGP